MRTFRHWTPRYIADRLTEIAYQGKHPSAPWLTAEATRILSTYLRPTDVGLEFGSGRSTVWFASRIAQLISVEHDAAWFQKVQQLLATEGLRNVDYRRYPADIPDAQGGDTEYVRVMESLASESIDFVLVDGMYRDYCAREAQRVLKPGGLLIIDNINWFFPSDSHSPNSRKKSQGPNGAVWKQVWDVVHDWRSIWTSNGVTDTALYFKPLPAAPST